MRHALRKEKEQVNAVNWRTGRAHESRGASHAGAGPVISRFARVRACA
jgi:hypothetical protein